LIEHILYIGGLFCTSFSKSHLNKFKYTPLVFANYYAYIDLTCLFYYMSSLFPTSDMLTILESEFYYTLSSQSWTRTKVYASVISYTNSIPWTPRKYCVGIVLYFSCPAVSQTGYNYMYFQVKYVCHLFIC
jgi:hypothetical protein